MRRQLSSGLQLMSDQLDRMEALVSPLVPKPQAARPERPEAGEKAAEADVPEAEGARDPELEELKKRLDALERRLSRG